MPIAITPEKRLVAGARRIAAIQKLGMSRIEANIVKTVDDALKALIAERDENTCRIPLAPMEALRLQQKIVELERPRAKERQISGKSSDGLAGGRGKPANLTGSSGKVSTDRHSRETAEQAARATGYSAKTLRRVAEVEKAAEKKPAVYGDLSQKLGNHGTKVESVYKEFQKRQEQQKLDVAAAAAAKSPSQFKPDVRHCRMEQLLPSLSNVDAIITDPPYPKEYLPLYGELAKLAVKCLSPSGILAVMCGQSYLPEIVSLMTPHVPYRWTMAYLTPGGQSVQLWDRKVNTFWKPILVFGATDRRWLGDVVRSDVNDNDKRYHGWGQSESGIGRLIEALTEPGQLICDPFIGAGTVGVACVKLARKFVGCDCDLEHVQNSQKRMIVARESINGR